jgi:hypothetical protein
MRAASVPGKAVRERNLLAEARWWKDTTHDDRPTSLAQEGRWAARLAGVATGKAEREREIDFMSNIRIYPATWTGRGSDAPRTSFTAETKYLLYTDARFYDPKQHSPVCYQRTGADEDQRHELWTAEGYRVRVVGRSLRPGPQPRAATRFALRSPQARARRSRPAARPSRQTNRSRRV